MTLPEKQSSAADLAKPAAFQARQFSFPLGRRTYIMGILNVTPDSFADGGKYLALDLALQHAGEMLEQGADIIDVGGESTRPGGTPITSDEELSRVIPVIGKISQTYGCPVSVDTSKAVVAEAALAAGACLVNDVTGLQQEQAIADIAGRWQAGVVIMHNARLYRNQVNSQPAGDLMQDVLNFLQQSVRLALRAGLRREQLVLDPGIGFGVTPGESMQMIACLDRLACLNLPILSGPSRKRFIGFALGRPEADRLLGTCAAVSVSIVRGADFIRVHDVREMVEVARVTDAICRERS
jgi:dihydropteroate synthase